MKNLEIDLSKKLEEYANLDQTEQEKYWNQINDEIDAFLQENPEKANDFAKNLTPQLFSEIAKLKKQIPKS